MYMIAGQEWTKYPAVCSPLVVGNTHVILLIFRLTKILTKARAQLFYVIVILLFQLTHNERVLFTNNIIDLLIFLQREATLKLKDNLTKVFPSPSREGSIARKKAPILCATGSTPYMVCSVISYDCFNDYQ